MIFLNKSKLFYYSFYGCGKICYLTNLHKQIDVSAHTAFIFQFWIRI